MDCDIMLSRGESKNRHNKDYGQSKLFLIAQCIGAWPWGVAV